MVNPVSTKSISSALLSVFVCELTYVQIVNLMMLKSQIKIETLYYHSLKLLLLNGREMFLHFSLLNSCCRNVIQLRTHQRCGTANAVFALGGLYAASGTGCQTGKEETTKEASDQDFTP